MRLPGIPHGSPVGLENHEHAVQAGDGATVQASLESYWSLDAATLLDRQRSTPDGLTTAVAAARLGEVGPNRLREQDSLSWLQVLARQLRNPLLLLLLFAAGVSTASGAWIDAGIVLIIVAASAGISYSREYSAQSAVVALRARGTPARRSCVRAMPRRSRSRSSCPGTS